MGRYGRGIARGYSGNLLNVVPHGRARLAFWHLQRPGDRSRYGGGPTLAERTRCLGAVLGLCKADAVTPSATSNASVSYSGDPPLVKTHVKDSASRPGRPLKRPALPLPRSARSSARRSSKP